MVTIRLNDAGGKLGEEICKSLNGAKMFKDNDICVDYTTNPGEVKIVHL